MAFIIPNATAIGGGLKYVNINQAEPDSLDTEILGLRDNWVRSGGVVSVAGGVVSVTSGVVVIGGKPYSFAAPTPSTPVAAANARFDLAVARLTGASVSVVFVKGNDSGTNPTLPQSRSTRAGDAYDGTINIDPATDVVLASIYVDSGVVASGNIVDKRVVDTRPITYVSTSAPTNQTYDVIGDTVVYNSIAYIKVNSTTWMQVADKALVDASIFPVGSIFAWGGVDSGGSLASGTYLPASGQSLSKTTYAALYDAFTITNSPNPGSRISCPFGETATHFNLPSLNTGFRGIVGGTWGEVGTAGGSTSTTLVTANMPPHKHSVSVAKHGNLEHDGYYETVRNDGNTYTVFKTNLSGAHYHTTDEHSHRGALVYRVYNDHNGFHVIYNSSHSGDAFHVDALGVNEENPGNPFGSFETDSTEYTELTRFMADSNPDTNAAVPATHQHQIGVNDHTISAHSVTEATIGSGTAFTTMNPYVKMQWYIRVK